MSLISGTLWSDLGQLVHIGPLRQFPRRAYRLTGESPRDVGLSGENWLSILLQSRDRQRLSSQVNFWLAKLGYTLRIEWGKQGYVHPMLKDEAGLECSLKDVGFGISQVLPVLIQGFCSRPGTILILEQPEIHLHPRAQAVLADILLAIARRGVRLLVETHSENLLLRIRRRLAEGAGGSGNTAAIGSDDIDMYYIEQIENHSEVTRVAMDEFGQFVDPPERFKLFLSDDYHDALQWGRAVAQARQEANHESGH